MIIILKLSLLSRINRGSFKANILFIYPPTTTSRLYCKAIQSDYISLVAKKVAQPSHARILRPHDLAHFSSIDIQYLSMYMAAPRLARQEENPFGNSFDGDWTFLRSSGRRMDTWHHSVSNSVREVIRTVGLTLLERPTNTARDSPRIHV